MKTEIMPSSKTTKRHWYIELSDNLRKSRKSTTETICRIYLENYHDIGSQIIAARAHLKAEKITQETLLDLLVSTTGHGKRNLQYAVQFAETYPDLSKYFQAPNSQISWTGVKKELAMDAEPNGGKESARDNNFDKCPTCDGKGYVSKEEGT